MAETIIGTLTVEREHSYDPTVDLSQLPRQIYMLNESVFPEGSTVEVVIRISKRSET